MGDPRKFKNKTNKPKKLWDEDRIKEESKLKREYGLKNMREIWLAREELRKYRRQARKLLSLPEEERKAEETKLLSKLQRIGVFEENNNLEDVLKLDVRNILDRRLQTIVFKLGLAKTIKQARQLIVHRFIKVEENIVDSPSFLVNKDLESKITYAKKIDLEPKIVEKQEEVKEDGNKE